MSKNFQAGRSMIEMLGVLAIIGVLSVGGISGYSKALFMYKSNQQAEQLSSIINTMFIYKDSFYETETNLIPMLKSLSAIPESMYVEGTNEYLKDSFGVKYRVFTQTNSTNEIAVSIDNSRRSQDICKNLYKVAKSFHNEIWFIQIGRFLDGPTGGNYTSKVFGDAYCNDNRLCLKDITPVKLEDLCHVCIDGYVCMLYFMLYPIKK